MGLPEASCGASFSLEKKEMRVPFSSAPLFAAGGPGMSINRKQTIQRGSQIVYGVRGADLSFRCSSVPQETASDFQRSSQTRRCQGILTENNANPQLIEKGLSLPPPSFYSKKPRPVDGASLLRWLCGAGQSSKHQYRNAKSLNRLSKKSRLTECRAASPIRIDLSLDFRRGGVDPRPHLRDNNPSQK